MAGFEHGSAGVGKTTLPTVPKAMLANVRF